jgi:hypothetical protein
MINTKKMSLFIIILIIVTICIVLLIKYSNNYISGFMDYFDCYLKITDVNPQLVGAYMKYDNKHVKSGVCENARLHVTVEPCPIDTNGIPLSTCNEAISLISSKGNPLQFMYSINPMNVGNFFGI